MKSLSDNISLIKDKEDYLEEITKITTITRMQVKTLNKVMLAGCSKSGVAPTATRRLLLTTSGSAAAQQSPQPTPSVAMKATIKTSTRTNRGALSRAFSRRQFSSRRDNNKGRHGSPGRSHSPGSPIAPRRSRGSSFDQLKDAVK